MTQPPAHLVDELLHELNSERSAFLAHLAVTPPRTPDEHDHAAATLARHSAALLHSGSDDCDLRAFAIAQLAASHAQIARRPVPLPKRTARGNDQVVVTDGMTHPVATGTTPASRV